MTEEKLMKLLNDAEIQEAIRSRSARIANKFPNIFSKEDLVQEGNLVIIKLAKGKENVDKLLIFKALNNKYSEIMRLNSARKRRNIKDVDDCSFDRINYKEWQNHSPKEEDIDWGAVVEKLKQIPIEKRKALTPFQLCKKIGVPEELWPKYNSLLKRNRSWRKLMNAK